ncbi:hypothetical protein BEP19_15200 [Ammoniphilus oxalaticus]|uniref:Probable inosine/xanthosine triphosphatase n=2 Tax=Ammoniphilus oxalaticus TaxID=66863 RepID=A0A419SDI9_9BACL|nr:hypothetical protein BEP19_15200 [Ammoniphilus oxalaticus]
MIRVAVGSKNPAKLRAVEAAFRRMGIAAEVVGVTVPSGVSSQPFSDNETLTGAINRAKAAISNGYDFAIGLEGGVVETPPYGLFLCNWGAIIDQIGEIGVSGGHRLQLPEEIAKELRKGHELGTVIDRWANGANIHKNEGTIGILTRNQIRREQVFEDVVICAYAKFIK